MDTPSLSRALVRELLRRQREGLPARILDKTRLHVVDAVGIGLGARPSALAAQVMAAMAVGASGGTGGVLGAPQGAPPPQAAFVNAALMHILDYDDIHDEARLHPTTVSLGSALAVAPLTKASGRRVLEAVALGNELMCRLGAMLRPTGQGPGSDWFLTQLFGYLGAALSAGLVLGHDEDTLVSALGLAYMQAAGGKQAGFGTGSTARAIYPAFAAMGGVQSGMIAATGIAGPEQSLDGAGGLFRIYLGIEATPERRDFLLADSWHFEQVEIKLWPSCRLSHPYVAAALDLCEQLKLAGKTLADAQRIEVGVNASAAKLCRPIEDRRRPDTLQDAKYSIPWMVAFTLARGAVNLATLNDSALSAQDIHALADRVEIVENLPDRPGHPPAEIRLHCGDRVLQNPPVDSFAISPQQAHGKFESCLAEAGTPQRAQALWTRLLALDAEPDLGFLYA